MPNKKSFKERDSSMRLFSAISANFIINLIFKRECVKLIVKSCTDIKEIFFVHVSFH